MLRWVVLLTSALLGWGALLATVGIFDEVLGWNLFTARTEAILYGVFFSSLVLAAAGVAQSVVVGIFEIVKALESAGSARSGRGIASRRRRPTRVLPIAALTVVVLVLSLHVVDGRVEDSRRVVFRSLAEQLMAGLGPKLAAALPRQVTSEECPETPAEVRSLLLAIVDSDLVSSAAIYLPTGDGGETAWRIRARWDGSVQCRKAYGAKRYEDVVLAAFRKEDVVVQRFNTSDEFVWIQPVGADDRRAVVVIRGNEARDFRRR